MPEGPEIRLAADRVEAALAGREIEAIEFAFESLRGYEAILRGSKVTAVETRGKAMLTHFDNGWSIYSHNQLYGRWYVCDRGDFPETARQLRLALYNREYSALLYSASEIDVLKTQNLDQHPFLARLGPDILNQKPSAEDIVSRLKSPGFRNRQLGALLLDQGFVAGLGNYLRAEILTHAGLYPGLRASACSDAQLFKLAGCMIRLTQRSYRTRGIINPPSLVKRLKASGYRRREQYRFNSFDRAGQACHFCGTGIELRQMGGRNLFYCPGCQPAP